MDELDIPEYIFLWTGRTQRAFRAGLNSRKKKKKVYRHKRCSFTRVAKRGKVWDPFLFYSVDVDVCMRASASQVGQFSEI